MKTIKVIHYPEEGNRTTEIFEAEYVTIVEGYLHELPSANIDRTFGANMNDKEPHKYWVILLSFNGNIMLAGLNSKVYIMVDGKTVASYESIVIE
jgi:hypothetical protein